VTALHDHPIRINGHDLRLVDEELTGCGEQCEEAGRPHAILDDDATLGVHDESDDPSNVLTGSRLDRETAELVIAQAHTMAAAEHAGSRARP